MVRKLQSQAWAPTTYGVFVSSHEHMPYFEWMDEIRDAYAELLVASGFTDRAHLIPAKTLTTGAKQF
ncbi:hypothetical protein [Diaminobutyricimonas sp. LJ205]|uniref:hypothetical protein n=1 Tax=Diaminobutyricimonas sp. LJ205 TaxID=2683590 RepID=UPI0012F4E040|nr:hypothetical protein [Diaminobutyricimonas sp. LJ205]